MATVALTLSPVEDFDLVVPILIDAVPYENHLRSELSSPSLTVYAAWLSEELIGAVAVHWDEVSEIMLLGVVSARRRQGHGISIVSAVIEEARRPNVSKMLVGTASFSLDNILFYQRCGFRMSHVRRDFFRDCFPDLQPLIWRGITLRDMIVLDFEVASS